jgi:glycosyltransferase involved in cell wall biosynthesis
MQGAQASSRHAGIGRYTMGLVRAMAAARGGDELVLLLNTRFTDAAAEIVAEFGSSLEIRRWHAPEGCAARSEPQAPLRRAAEHIRAQSIADAAPDAVLVPSVFEGWDCDAVGTWPEELERPFTAAVMHDLIPLTLRGLYLDGAWREAGLVPWYHRNLWECARLDLLLANSEATRDEARRHLRVPAERVPVIHAGAEARFRPVADGAEVLARHGLSEGFVLSVGLGDLRKNSHTLFAAYASLPAELRARHKLAVRHVNPPAAESEARAAGLRPGEVKLLGFIPDEDLPALYSAASLFVLPSVAEGFGLPLVEAMACGTPAIASDRSSMPEILGRPDLLFDPDDAASLAAVMRRALADEAWRAEIAAHAPRQAARFTWERSAEVAWSALREAAPRPLRGRPRPRPTLAVVAPLPPSPSGVADYTAELAEALADHYAVTLVSPDPPSPEIAGRFPRLSETEFEAVGGRFDRVLHQIGNNILHERAATRLLPLHPGVVTLHDPALSDFRLWIAAVRQEGDAQRWALLAEEGYPALCDPAPLHEAMLRRQGSAGVLRGALGVVLHSRYALSLLETAYGPDAVAEARVIPLLRAPRALPGREEARRILGIPAGDLLVCSFGYVTAKKFPGRLTAAWAEAMGQRREARLVFVGDAEGDCRAALHDGLNAAQRPRVQLTGRQDHARYGLWLAAADIAVQLRGSSRGETSGAVMDVLAAGVPLVVNASGSFAELPAGAVAMLPEDPPVPAIAAALRRLAEEEGARRALGAKGAAYARDELSPRAVAALYRDAIEAAYGTGRQAGMAALLGAGRFLPLRPGDAGPLGSALAATWPPAQTPRLWLDVGTDAVARTAPRLLREGAKGLRPEPMRAAGGQAVSAHAWAWEALALPGGPPPETPVEFAPGDAVSTADPVLRRLALARGASMAAD